jgi:RHS repeat-associated protein
LTGIAGPISGQNSSLTRNAQGGIDALLDPLGNTFSYTYDTFGNIDSFTDPNHHTTTFVYDALGHLTSFTEPSVNPLTFAYDEAGNLIDITNPDGGVIQESFDDLNRLTEIKFPDDSTWNYQHDANGNTTQIQSALGNESRTFDVLNRLASATGPFGKTVSYAYDANGNVTAMTYPGDKTVTYTYDALNRLTSVTDWLGQKTTYKYDAAGRHVETDYPNGVITAYTYDAADRLIGLSHTQSGGKVLAKYDITRDVAGNPIQEIRNEPVVSILSVGQHTYTYDNANRLTAIDGDAVTVDENGNITALGTTTYGFAPDNRLTQVDRDGIQTHYVYSGAGYRYVRDDDGAENRFILDVSQDPARILAETDGSGKINAYYIYGLGPISRLDATGNNRFYLFDPRGDTVVLTDKNGKQTDAYAYGPYGQTLNHLGDTPNPFTFLARNGVTDEGHGLFYIDYRYYAADLGRFISNDSRIPHSQLNGQTLNLYTYALDNPQSNIDISGNRAVSFIKGHAAPLPGIPPSPATSNVPAPAVNGYKSSSPGRAPNQVFASALASGGP